ncbi:MAG: HAMP domain-containing histidine kinase, partial [Spirochaetales bacterium]|nr:HAMP domain-containing histidine kinase [Spirochaetales bacterium]
MDKKNIIKNISFKKISKKEGLLSIIFSFSFLFIAAIFEIILVNVVFKIKLYVPIGMVIIILAQSFALSKRYLKALSPLEASSNELELFERSRQLENINRQKTNFFINLAHEIKTPLTLISNYLELYTRKVKMSDELYIIKRNIDKLKHDMINFLDVEKIKQGRMDYNHNNILDLSTLISEREEIFKGIVFQRDIKIVSHVETNIFIKADRFALETVLNNLLSNALKYTDDKGEIKIILESNDKKVILTIQDTGIGIPEDKFEEIFLPYYQISNGKSNMHGIGMGLYIVNKIVKSLNGKITVTSKQGEGTKLTIILNRYFLLEGEGKKGRICKVMKSSSMHNYDNKNNTPYTDNNWKHRSCTGTTKLKDSCFSDGKNTI